MMIIMILEVFDYKYDSRYTNNPEKDVVNTARKDHDT